MTVKVGINGFGRIGRTVFRAYLSNLKEHSSQIEIVAVNNPLKKGQKIKDFIHMLKFDTVHGRLNNEFEVGDDYFLIDGKLKVSFNIQMDPSSIDWSKDNVDVVIDSTGIFKDIAGLGKHLHGSVKKVVMSAPGTGLDGTFVMGVNNHLYDKTKHHIISNASCTTNCLAPIVKVLDDVFGVEKGLVSTCHSVTADQRLVDGEHDDLRRARAAGHNIIPTKTGAAIAVGEVLPHLKGKLDGIALRVPTLNVSVVDGAFILKTSATAEQINDEFKKAASGAMKGILSVCDLELVSSDFIGDPHSSIVDSKYTKVMDGNMVKVLSWYDNEFGYSSRLLDLVKILI
jgi:glyceraldehyde 3-phosphate dehydrogenase